MTRLLQRIVQVRAGPPGGEGRLLGNGDNGKAGNHVTFATRAGDVGRPAECKLVMFNLRDDTIGLFEKASNVVRVKAGYRGDSVQQIFEGNPAPDTLKSRKQSGDIATEVTIRDGGRKYDEGRLEVSLSGHTTARQVLDAVKESTGLGEGQVDLGNVSWRRRYVFSGPARDALDDIVEAAGPGYRWFIRDGNIYILDREQVTPGKAPVFSSKDGTLVGTPETVEGNLIRFTGMLVAGVRVGGVVKLESERITGFYKVVEEAKEGNNFNGGFYVKVKGRRRA